MKPEQDKTDSNIYENRLRILTDQARRLPAKYVSRLISDLKEYFDDQLSESIKDLESFEKEDIHG